MKRSTKIGLVQGAGVLAIMGAGLWFLPVLVWPVSAAMSGLWIATFDAAWERAHEAEAVETQLLAEANEEVERYMALLDAELENEVDPGRDVLHAASRVRPGPAEAATDSKEQP